MGVVGGPRNHGLFDNANFRKKSNSNFTWGTYRATGGPNNGPYLEVTGGGGSGAQSTNFIEVDTSFNYRMVCYAKTITPGSSGNNAGGHIGFNCYDSNYNRIDLRHCKGLGDTQLTRAASPGDTTIYVSSISGWSNSSTNHQRGFMLFGGQYPYSGGYTRYAVTSNGYVQNGLTDIGGGEYTITLASGLGTYSDALNGSNQYPVGTYVANGRAGGTYNYALSNPSYPTTWTRYTTSVFTGESRNSSTPFRYGTKYIRFLILRNYNRRTESPQDHVWGIAKIFFGRVIGRQYGTSSLTV